MRTLLPILGVALLVGLVALTGSAAAAPDTGADTTTNNEAVNETVTVAGEDVTVKAGETENGTGAFAFASAGADPGEDGSGAGGGVRVANQYGGVNYDGDAGGQVETDDGETEVASSGAGSGAFVGITNPFYGVGAGGGAELVKNDATGNEYVLDTGAGAGCFGFAPQPPSGCSSSAELGVLGIYIIGDGNE
jgi:hypothetical protein